MGKLTEREEANRTTLIEPSVTIFTIHGKDNEPLVEMFRDGTIAFGPNYDPDTAARLWWETVAGLVPVALLDGDAAFSRGEAAGRERELATIATLRQQKDKALAEASETFVEVSEILSGSYNISTAEIVKILDDGEAACRAALTPET